MRPFHTLWGIGDGQLLYIFLCSPHLSSFPPFYNIGQVEFWLPEYFFKLCCVFSALFCFFSLSRSVLSSKLSIRLDHQSVLQSFNCVSLKPIAYYLCCYHNYLPTFVYCPDIPVFICLQSQILESYSVIFTFLNIFLWICCHFVPYSYFKILHRSDYYIYPILIPTLFFQQGITTSGSNQLLGGGAGGAAGSQQYMIGDYILPSSNFISSSQHSLGLMNFKGISQQ